MFLEPYFTEEPKVQVWAWPTKETRPHEKIVAVQGDDLF